MSDEQSGSGGGAGIAAGGFGVIGIGLIVTRLVLLAARIGAHETSSYEPPPYSYSPSSYSGGIASSDDFSQHSFFVKASDGVHATTDMPSSWAKAESVKMHVVVDADGTVTDATCDGCDALLRIAMYDVKFSGGAGEFDVDLTKAF